MKKTIDPQNIKMIFFDIDDTLRVKDTGYMPPSVNEAVKKLHAKQISIGIASGRALYGVVPEIMALDPDYFVMINGQHVSDKAKHVLYSNPIERSDIEAFIAWSQQHGLPYGMAGAADCAVSAWTPIVANAMGPVYGIVKENPTFYQANEVYQLWSFSEDQIEYTIPDALLKHLKVVRWSPRTCDLFPINGSKAKGIAIVLEKLGLTKDNIVVFGDGLNDLEMFQYAGFAVAMGNAHEDVKPHADFITKDLMDDGIFHALKTLDVID